ncbi:hypothetical protein CH46_628 [Yersinia pestis]|nr:hypothetical protein CH46_628 [Yersinia pestis]
MTGIGPLTNTINQCQHALFTVTSHHHILTVGTPAASDGQPWYLSQHICGRRGGLAGRGIPFDDRYHHWRFKTATLITGCCDDHGVGAVLFTAGLSGCGISSLSSKGQGTSDCQTE